jgi:hypothetical protein
MVMKHILLHIVAIKIKQEKNHLKYPFPFNQK